MAEELERNGDKAIVDEDYDQAVTLYTQAIDLIHDNPSLYVSRAQAHIKLQNYTDAVSDANRALEFDPGLSKAHLRKGTAYFYLEDYQSAKSAFEAGAAVDPNSSHLKLWIRKCDAELAADADKEEADAGLVATPSGTSTETVNDTLPHVRDMPMDTVNGTGYGLQNSAESSGPGVSVPQLPPQPRYRHEWYQTDTHAVVTIFAKNIKQDQLNVEFGEQILSVVISTPVEEPFYLQLRLFGKIKPLESKYNILSTKVEIRLNKNDTVQWNGLEYNPALALVAAPILSAPRPAAPRKPSRNWEKLEAEVKKAEKDEKLEGDAALNKLFQDIYSNADEDTRRAMNKSFVESNGTVLSTNWKEVGSKKVDGSPPKGMEMRKWEQ